MRITPARLRLLLAAAAGTALALGLSGCVFVPVASSMLSTPTPSAVMERANPEQSNDRPGSDEYDGASPTPAPAVPSTTPPNVFGPPTDPKPTPRITTRISIPPEMSTPQHEA